MVGASLESSEGMIIEILEAGIPIALAILYGLRVAKLKRLGREPSIPRQIAFVGALVLIALTSVPPLGPLSTDLVSGHMLTHTILTDEASLLLAFGLTGAVLGPVLTAPGFKSLRWLTHPIVVLVLWVVVVYAWHVPALYQAAAGPGLLHMVEHVSFITVGTLLWMSVLGTFPQPRWFGPVWRVALVVVAHLSMMALANYLMWSSEPHYPDYVASALARDIDPVTDQGIAGAILMIQGGLVMISVFIWSLIRWERTDTERQSLLDYAAERGVPLADERAQRAASSGHGDALRRRIDREAAELSGR